MEPPSSAALAPAQPGPAYTEIQYATVLHNYLSSLNPTTRNSIFIVVEELKRKGSSHRVLVEALKVNVGRFLAPAWDGAREAVRLVEASLAVQEAKKREAEMKEEERRRVEREKEESMQEERAGKSSPRDGAQRHKSPSSQSAVSTSESTAFHTPPPDFAPSPNTTGAGGGAEDDVDMDMDMEEDEALEPNTPPTNAMMLVDVAAVVEACPARVPAPVAAAATTVVRPAAVVAASPSAASLAPAVSPMAPVAAAPIAVPVTSAAVVAAPVVAAAAMEVVRPVAVVSAMPGTGLVSPATVSMSGETPVNLPAVVTAPVATVPVATTFKPAVAPPPVTAAAVSASHPLLASSPASTSTPTTVPALAVSDSAATDSPASIATGLAIIPADLGAPTPDNATLASNLVETHRRLAEAKSAMDACHKRVAEAEAELSRARRALAIQAQAEARARHEHEVAKRAISVKQKQGSEKSNISVAHVLQVAIEKSKLIARESVGGTLKGEEKVAALAVTGPEQASSGKRVADDMEVDRPASEVQKRRITPTAVGATTQMTVSPTLKASVKGPASPTKSPVKAATSPIKLVTTAPSPSKSPVKPETSPTKSPVKGATSLKPFGNAVFPTKAPATVHPIPSATQPLDPTAKHVLSHPPVTSTPVSSMPSLKAPLPAPVPVSIRKPAPAPARRPASQQQAPISVNSSAVHVPFAGSTAGRLPFSLPKSLPGSTSSSLSSLSLNSETEMTVSTGPVDIGFKPKTTAAPAPVVNGVAPVSRPPQQESGTSAPMDKQTKPPVPAVPASSLAAFLSAKKAALVDLDGKRVDKVKEPEKAVKEDPCKPIVIDVDLDPRPPAGQKQAVGEEELARRRERVLASLKAKKEKEGEEAAAAAAAVPKRDVEFLDAVSKGVDAKRPRMSPSPAPGPRSATPVLTPSAAPAPKSTAEEMKSKLLAKKLKDEAEKKERELEALKMDVQRRQEAKRAQERLEREMMEAAEAAQAEMAAKPVTPVSAVGTVITTAAASLAEQVVPSAFPALSVRPAPVVPDASKLGITSASAEKKVEVVQPEPKKEVVVESQNAEAKMEVVDLVIRQYWLSLCILNGI
ncbi:hypothetical protein HK101_007502 [Irineochytrium annulatum]|nr:hypothetical protein HK101_007502 [Irineochytrium annulatum]